MRARIQPPAPAGRSGRRPTQPSEFPPSSELPPPKEEESPPEEEPLPPWEDDPPLSSFAPEELSPLPDRPLPEESRSDESPDEEPPPEESDLLECFFECFDSLFTDSGWSDVTA